MQMILLNWSELKQSIRINKRTSSNNQNSSDNQTTNYWTILLELFTQYYGFFSSHEHQQIITSIGDTIQIQIIRIVIELNDKKLLVGKAHLVADTHTHTNARLKGSQHTEIAVFFSSSKMFLLRRGAIMLM